MGMETGNFHLIPVLNTFGPTCYPLDQLLLEKRMDDVDEKEVKKGLNWFEKLLGNRLKYDDNMLTPEKLKTQIRLYLAMHAINEENGLDFCGVKAQTELTEYICISDVAEMIMNDPYDWNGEKESTVCSTEADAYAALTMQILKYISGGLPTLLMDVQKYHKDKDFWDFCNSGNFSSWYAAQSLNPVKNFKEITFHPALEYIFKAGGASVEFTAAPGDMTFARLGIWDDKQYMVIANGESLKFSSDERKKINEQTSPTWPHVHARINCIYDEFESVFPSNHIHGVAGDIVDSLIYYCEIIGVEPIILGDKERIKPIWKRI